MGNGVRAILVLLVVAALPACGGSGGPGLPAIPNVAPDFAAVPNRTGYFDRDFYYDLGPSVTDDLQPAADLTYAVTSGPGAFVGSLYYHHFAATGSVPVTVAVTDAGGLGDAATFTVDVLPNAADPLTFPAGSIFVSATAGSDVPTAGTSAADPTQTIAFGIGRAQATGSARVLVAAGYYPESISLFPGIDVLAGYDSTFTAYDVAAYPAILAGNPDGTATRTLICSSITTATTVEGFIILGPRPTATGTSAVTVYILNCGPALSLQNNIIYGGDGANGGPGTPGTAGVSGANGSPGLVPLVYTLPTPAPTRAGGAGGLLTAGGDVINGGNGGSADAPGVTGPPYVFSSESAGVTGQPGAGATGGAPGTGGSGGKNAIWLDATSILLPDADPLSMVGHNGTPGSSGANAGAGAGASAGGTVSAGDWITQAGGSGLQGGNGGGGGGGGAAGGILDLNDRRPETGTVGATGGGGGSGGAGGGPGTGGQGGGASIGIFVISNGVLAPTLSGNTIHVGRGGPGGSGGVGANGGQGGQGGGITEDPAQSWMATAGRGADGGAGGHGSGGGGGAGGDAVGIQTSNVPAGSTTTWSAGNGVVTVSGAPGAGGTGGPSAGNSGGAGASGVTASVR